MRRHVQVATTLMWALPLYWLAIFPRTRAELRGWEVRADAIPDPVLRAHALGKLHSEHLTAEGAAAFAILAAASARRDVVRLCVAFEVLYDFLDALAEQPVADVLANNRRLYGALVAAVTPGMPHADYYAFSGRHDDGGYVRGLVEACRASLVRLEAHPQVLPALRRLAEHANEAQSLHHAVVQVGDLGIAAWARAQQLRADPQLHWWELAAAAGSPLGVFALIAAASRRDTGAQQVADIERAYLPCIAALSWLLESLVDLRDDLDSGTPSYVSHYASERDAAQRLALIAGQAAADARELPQAARHTVLLTGMVAMSLSHRGAQDAAARRAAAAVRRAIGGPVGPLTALLSLRRALTRLHGASRAWRTPSMRAPNDRGQPWSRAAGSPERARRRPRCASARRRS